MVYRKGELLMVNHKGEGQFLAKVVEDFDTEKDTVAKLEGVNRENKTCRIQNCKFKAYEGAPL